MNNQEKTAYHEAGHHIVATHFGLASFPELTPGGYVAPGSSEVLPYDGVCHHDRAKSLFQQAVICWAGVLAVHMIGECYEWSPPVPLRSKFLRDWFDMFLQKGFNYLSHGDQIGILADRKRTWRSFKTAWRILWRSRARLKALAAHVLVAAGSPHETPDEQERKAIAWRAGLLEKFLADLPADHPDRAKWEAVLGYYKRGEWPPPEPEAGKP